MRKPPGKSDRLTIGGLAEAGSVKVATVLYYQRLELLAEPPRPKHGGFRTYAAQDVDRLRQIKSAQALGFTLKEIKLIFSCLEKDDCASVRPLVTKRAQALQNQIRQLEHARQRLVKLASCCTGKRSDGFCALLQTEETPAPTAPEA